MWDFKNEFSNDIPERVIKKFQKYFIGNVGRNALLSNEQFKLTDMLEKAGILVMPLKGPFLSYVVYGNDSLRFSSDIDIFVKESHAIEARDLLIANGYQSLDKIDFKYDNFYLKIEHAFNLHNPNNNICVDLQWKILGSYTSEPITIEKIESKLIKQHYGDRFINQLSPEYLLFYLCVHGSKDGWRKFEWICCISEFLKKHTDFDWEEIYRLSKKENCFKKLLLGLFLAKSLCDAPLPQKADTYIKQNPTVINAGRKFIELYLNNKSVAASFTDNSTFSPFNLQIQDDWRNIARYIIRQIFKPTAKDLSLFPLHKKLVFLYYIYRPLRLLWRIFIYSFNKFSRKSSKIF
ncbi:hypothetical protein HRM2_25450 [Desulforapulum autotrophicum HRM2]|uniref:Nucleotidyltransferase family protein n=1 Tax=Desulforapulum autotrophicum (strain ATCC 43914 / DSM 3382 / VKM B-1955 / HRM2) TaxID=177437 RepID=C0QGZ0_DESAH|nr:nucleotidyltransferase family protein [Desulforapulum autotrophicum]ACN15639.1 hypothetical protein HRM2_25450 [Desulforapulum autotrophicum HRM2]